MPHIAVTMYPGRTEEQKRRLAEKLRDTVINEIGADRKHISVSVEEIKPENWEKNLENFEGLMYMENGELK